MRIIAIDPGVQHSAVAIFEDGEFACCALLRGSVGVQAAELRFLCSDWTPWLCVSEQMRVYPKKQKEDPNDLIAVSFVAGALAIASGAEVIEKVPATTWKGGTPKHIHHPRIEAELPQCVVWVHEAAPPSLRHNVWDAIGIGYWAATGKKL